MKNFNQTFISKTLCTFLVLSILILPSSAAQNHVYTTTTTENYSAASPVGRFENSTTNGAIAPIYNYNYSGYPAYMPQPYIYQPYYSNGATQTSDKEGELSDNKDASGTQVAYGYPTPVYTAGAMYANPNFNQTSSVQDIEAPQDYNKTVTTTQEYVDTREKADKVIDRGVKVLGTLAVVGAAAGLLFKAFD